MDFFKTFSQKISKIQDSENFILIGDSNFIIDDREMNFEIHCRYNPFNPEAELEILFNDVTRAKLKEKNNAEYKYKTRFLSKVAHEFKNPLICISELIDQSVECLPKQGKILNTNNLSTNLKQIKALCSYLHILMKDLNFYSQSNQGSITTYEKQEISVKDLVDFCKNITNTLIVKSNKSKAIDLLINVDKDVPRKILSDESRLKQLLINLLSNAVKFTLYGHILFDVSYRKNKTDNQAFLKFIVKDTGVGIKTDKLEDLLKCSLKDQETKGECFGLSISCEIAQKLGKGLQFKSQVGQGSNFWFLVDASEDKIKLNSSTTKCKSSQAVSKRGLSNCFELSQLSLSSEEEIIFTKNIKSLEAEGNEYFSDADSQNTRQLDVVCFVKPDNYIAKSSSSHSLSPSHSNSIDSKNLKDIELNHKIHGELNFFKLSKNLNFPKLVFSPEKTSKENKHKESTQKFIRVKIY